MADFFSIIWDGVVNVLNSIFNPILAMDPNPANPALTVLIIAFIVSLITTIANKYLVDQEEMEAIQKRNKEFQKELRDAQKRGDGKKVSELQAKQSEMMAVSRRIRNRKPTAVGRVASAPASCHKQNPTGGREAPRPAAFD